MDLADFTDVQKQAILDLLVLATYVDGRLTSTEDARIEGLLAAMDLELEFERQRAWDDSVTRVRQHTQTAEKVRRHAAELAKQFTQPEQCQKVSEWLEDLIQSDDQVSVEENHFLSVVQDVFLPKSS